MSKFPRNIYIKIESLPTQTASCVFISTKNRINKISIFIRPKVNTRFFSRATFKRDPLTAFWRSTTIFDVPLQLFWPQSTDRAPWRRIGVVELEKAYFFSENRRWPLSKVLGYVFALIVQILGMCVYVCMCNIYV